MNDRPAGGEGGIVTPQTPPRAWKECPVCYGKGRPSRAAYDPDEDSWLSGMVAEESTKEPCPTCAAHFAALDAAVQVEREACAVIAATKCCEEMGDGTTEVGGCGMNRIAVAIRSRTGGQP